MSSEYFRKTILETCSPDLLESYRFQRRMIQAAISSVLDPWPDPDSPEWSEGYFTIRRAYSPYAVEQDLAPDSPATKAAMLMGAVCLRAWPYTILDNNLQQLNFADIWKSTKLHALAAKCDEVISEIVPETKGRFVSIDLNEMSRSFQEKLGLKAPEHIVLSGLNATGKSFLIGLLTEFLQGCDIPAKVIKTPRPDGPLSQVINKVLNGHQEFRKDALQLAFLSDALDIDPEPETLVIFDRHPKIEAFVYGPTEIARTVLSTHEQFSGIYHTFIIDQHPMACAIKIAQRDRSPRIFEADVENMTEQLIRFARISVLPGLHWVNCDLAPMENFQNRSGEFLIVRQFFRSLANSGVIQRQLMKQGRFDSYEKANEFANSVWQKFATNWNSRKVKL